MMWMTCALLMGQVACSGGGDSADSMTPTADAAMDVGALDVGALDEGVMADAAPGGDAEIAPDDAGTGVDGGRVYPEPTFGLTRYTLEHGGLTREYLVYVPESYSADTATPVVFNFHGNGGSADNYFRSADLRSVADAENVILVYPQGSVLDGEGSHWNPLLDSELNKSDADDFGFVSAMLDWLGAQLNVDTRRVYATGYSNGAGMVYGLACYLSARIAAFAPVSGSMYIEMRDTCNPVHPSSIAVFNGTRDGIRPYEGYPGFLLPVEDAVAFWTGHNQISDPPVTESFSTNGLTVERSTYSGGAGGAGVALYKVVGGDHVWFDINIEGADQGRIIWDFVSRYDLDGLR
mgnify:CR=1 FL=1